MKTVLLSVSLLIWIFCFQQYCFLGAVNAVLGENCTSAENCTSSNSTCIHGTCECIPGWYQNLTTCLTQHGLFDSCNTTEECLGDNVQCKQNNCTCNDQYYYQNGFCYEKIGFNEFCNETKECRGDHVECSKEHYCHCEDEYYNDDEDKDCLRKHEIFDSCNDTRECLGDNTQCKQNNCTCKDKYYDQNGTCYDKLKLFDSCNDTRECFGENTQCKLGNCTCKDKYYDENGFCHAKHEIFDSCNDTRECLGENTQCKQKTCTCKDKYYDQKGSCYEKHGLFEPCKTTHECLGKNVECNNRNCTCNNNHFYDAGSCHQKRSPKSACKSDNMCIALSRCINTKCECITDHYSAGSTCFLKVEYGDVCRSDNECRGENIICSNKCTCKDGYEFEDSVCKEKSSSTLIIIIVILILLLLCVLGYILWKIKWQKSGDFNPPPEITQIKLNIPRHRPILMSNFPEDVHAMHQDSNKIFAQQFLDLDRINPLILNGNSNLTSSKKYLPCHEATKPANTSKNRFLDILPFDHSRVKLKPVDDVDADDDDNGSDYINASYISGYSRENEYIAAQGPLSNTSTDFWRMIWQEKISIIVMLTLCREKEINKCDNYWPIEKDKKLDFDDITVETTNVTNHDSYDYRTMTLKMDEKSQSLKHFHFLHWADFSANVPVEVLIDFVRNVRFHITSNAPVVIHCSAGVGRTGTFIAVDYLLQFVDANPLDSNIDIFDFVSKMRENRVHMVQNKNQYILIHDCIRHAVKKKIAVEKGELDDENPYENEGFVTVELTDKPNDIKTSQGSVQIIIEKSEDEDEEEEEKEEEREKEREEDDKEKEEEEEENPYENEVRVSVHVTEDKEKNDDEVVDLEDNPYENEDLSNAEKDKANAYESDDNPYDIPENAMLINNDETESDKSNKDASEQQQRLVILEGEAAEDENPYENQDFGFGYHRMRVETDEKQKLTKF